jgi:phosphohistidine phosphatase
MELFVVRHAIAEDGADDDARPLSKKGVRRFRKMVGVLSRLGVTFDRIVHSPKRRAVETAELLVPLLEGELEVSALLTEAPTDDVLGLIIGASIAVVGHEPHLSALVSWLVGAPSSEVIELKKGAVAHLTGRADPGGMKLVALLPPRVARR